MDGLRWLLLLFGVLVVAGVYFYSRRQAEREEAPPDTGRRIAPTLEPESQEPEAEKFVSDDFEDVADSEPDDAIDEDAEEATAPAQKIVTLRVIARDRGAFPGDKLILSLRGIGMRHGKFGIFHCYDGADESRTIFSAASLVEPGSFDLANIKEQELPGVSLFLVLPGPIDGAEAFDMMIDAARALTQAMDAELLDESGSSLSIQRERYMREEIIQFQHSNLVA